ncbi:alpha/beta fold hydrolase [Yinghuangia seranimata]|uniref:alpha/beta fold hydrolase n=1 Tax=Yinghuangia seranimata TaxID=408067 RepID=UPI00248AE16C|nr:alpha/beta hydrolase [Yinghuangia seranimata]MDI2131051.1 alpha/beta hydrolase [Yinghuangia seranimata]
MTATVTARNLVSHDGTRLSYVDLGGPGRPVLALHGAYGRGRSLLGLGAELGPAYRLVAYDQRGHGLSDHPDEYTLDGLVGDAAAVIEGLGLGPTAVIGHSLGGAVAYHLAARRPELVSALVIADQAVDLRPPAGGIPDPLSGLPRRFPSFAALSHALAPYVGGDIGHFYESAVEHPDGWGFLWRAENVFAARRATRGDWWSAWTASTMPALLVRGGDSEAVEPHHAKDMVARRANTGLVEIGGAGHDFYLTHTAEFAALVRGFLDERLG